MIVCNNFLRTAKADKANYIFNSHYLRVFKRFIKICGYFIKPFVNSAAVW